MTKKRKIRPIVLGAIVDPRDRLLVSEVHDPIAQSTYYRALGGGIEFGELMDAALIREFQEELGTALVNLTYAGCLENIFNYRGKESHELVFVYRCQFADASLYNRESLPFWEEERVKEAIWIERQRFQSGELRLVPPGFLELSTV